MSPLLTPARLATLVGVLTGLSAAVTSLLDVFPKDTAVGRTIVSAVGVLATVISVAKFLEGQAGWEQLRAQHAHEAAQAARAQQHEAVLYGPDPIKVKVVEAKAESAELPDEVPLNTVDEAGLVMTAEDAETGEPMRLVDQQA